jgi:hypothetical protein
MLLEDAAVDLPSLATLAKLFEEHRPRLHHPGHPL